tara:strand:+ start:3191 stop:3634 length:444 start_codon:yes stop_codon:yes gene_type:complete
MADIGTITELVNNEKLLLQTGSDTFVLMQDCKLNLDRPISREVTSGAGVVYFFGAGDNSIDFTLLCSTPELEDSSGAGNLVYQTQRDTNGALPTNTYKIVATDISGATKTISATGTIPHLEVQRLSGVGGVTIVGRIQITTDSVSVA